MTRKCDNSPGKALFSDTWSVPSVKNTSQMLDCNQSSVEELLHMASLFSDSRILVSFWPVGETNINWIVQLATFYLKIGKAQN